MHCNEVVRFIVRCADESEPIPESISTHLESCASCRVAFDTQRVVSAWLRTRPADRLSPQFAARLAARLDEASGWFGIADWRAWTLRLAPVAAALALATYLGLGASTQAPTTTIEEWTLGGIDSSTESDLWDSGVSAESVMETMLTGELPTGRGETGNGR